MKVVGVVAEFNPFHKGHAYLAQGIKKDLNPDAIVAIMSASFVQRGQPAILDKYIRASHAIQGGYDLVIELPAYFSLQSSAGFAQGALSIIENSQVFTHLAFGTESGNLNLLKKAVEIKKSQAYNNLVLKGLAQGNSYGRAQTKAMENLLKVDFNAGSNDVLAMAYLEHLPKTIKPLTIKRKGHAYHSTETSLEFPSATGIRKKLLEGKLEESKDGISPSTYKDLLELTKPKTNQTYLDLLVYKLNIQSSPMDQICGYEDGMENLLQSHLSKSTSFSDLVSRSTSKRYSKSRIRRVILSYLLNINVSGLKESLANPYFRPLAFNDRGRQVLAKVKKQNNIAYIDKFAQAYKSNPNWTLLKTELAATRLYNLGYQGPDQDFIQSPIYLKKT